MPAFASALTFNHVIVAIPIPGGEPTQDLFAAVTDPKLGRRLFFDPTDAYVPLGYLPSPLQENYVLVAGNAGGELVRLPLLAPAANQLVRRAKAAAQSGWLAYPEPWTKHEWDLKHPTSAPSFLARPARNAPKCLKIFSAASWPGSI